MGKRSFLAHGIVGSGCGQGAMAQRLLLLLLGLTMVATAQSTDGLPSLQEMEKVADDMMDDMTVSTEEADGEQTTMEEVSEDMQDLGHGQEEIVELPQPIWQDMSNEDIPTPNQAPRTDAKSEQDESHQSGSDDATLGEPYLLSAMVLLGVAVPVVVAVVVRWQGSTLGRLQAVTDSAEVQHEI